MKIYLACRFNGFVMLAAVSNSFAQDNSLSKRKERWLGTTLRRYKPDQLENIKNIPGNWAAKDGMLCSEKPINKENP